VITLHPFSFDEVLDTVLTTKPKKKGTKQEAEEASAGKEDEKPHQE
jgi:hypothetical protein